jgi:DNA-binding HxlR family transcriptional regulator
MACPVHSFQQMISGKYKLRIIWDLREGPRRYGEIRRGLLRGKIGTDEIDARVLSRELKTLAEMGLIHRKDYRTLPPKVEYSLTPMGRSLIPLIGSMHEWSTRQLKVATKAAEAG